MMPSILIRKSPAVLAFAHFLRTGQRRPEHLFALAPPLEAKFNPYHDPRDGRFTTGPGVGGSDNSGKTSPAFGAAVASRAAGDAGSSGGFSDGVYRPAEGAPSLTLVGAEPEPPRGIGSNSGAFFDPMTLDQAFPGLSQVPGGSIIAVTANILDLTGPATDTTNQMSLNYTRALIADIKQYDPNYQFQSLGFSATLEGQMGQIDGLRWDRAAAIYKVTGNAGPLQVETLRFLQDRTDAEYDNALEAAKAGRLPPAPTERMAIGNYIDAAVKADFRDALNVRNLSMPTGTTVRVSGREYDSSGTDLTYSIPDARVEDVAFDMTLWQKTPKSRQIRQFFSSDFRPRAVVIVRPRQLGPDSSYIITRPGK